MKTRRTLIFSMLVFVLGLSLLMLGSPRDANALTTAEREAVAGYIDSYVDTMDAACSSYSDAWNTMTCRDEEIFFSVATQLKGMLDSNSDLTLLGVGDNMAVRPVLMDTLCATLTAIPGTTYRAVSAPSGCTNSWYYTANTTNASALRSRVEAYYEAGFGTDIHVY